MSYQKDSCFFYIYCHIWSKPYVSFDPEQPSDQKGKDFWLFCYFGNGMNVKDLAFLKYKNI